MPNATFHAFRHSGKWYTSARGILTPAVFKLTEGRRAQITHDNGGSYPGLSSTGNGLIFVVIPDEDVDFGYPLMLMPEAK